MRKLRNDINKIRTRFRWTIGVIGWLLCATAHAEAVLLVQGFLADGSTWRQHGIVSHLEGDGWVDGGHLRIDADGVFSNRAPKSGARMVYTVALPTQLPLATQLPVFERYVQFVAARHAGESLTLVGHSAGGLLGRYFMVENPEAGVSALITIATPHLGTESALFGADLANHPITELLASLGAPEIADMRGLLDELAPAKPGRFLYWLNHQPHPPAKYISLLRRASPVAWFDTLLIPVHHQDMASIPGLRPWTTSIQTGQSHELERGDGKRIATILAQLKRS